MIIRDEAPALPKTIRDDVLICANDGTPYRILSYDGWTFDGPSTMRIVTSFATEEEAWRYIYDEFMAGNKWTRSDIAMYVVEKVEASANEDKSYYALTGIDHDRPNPPEWIKRDLYGRSEKDFPENA